MGEIQLFPEGASFPTANYATLDTRNTRPCLDFDTGTDETAYWHFFLPEDYAGGGLTVTIEYAASTATTGTIQWSAQIERIGAALLDLDGDSFAAAQVSSAKTVPGTAGQADTNTIAFTNGAQMDSLAAGEFCRIAIFRDVSGDSAAGDAELYGVKITET